MGQGCTKHFNLLASVSHAASPFNGKGNNVTDENQQPAKTFIFDETLNSPFIQEILARLTDCEVQMLLYIFRKIVFHHRAEEASIIVPLSSTSPDISSTNLLPTWKGLTLTLEQCRDLFASCLDEKILKHHWELFITSYQVERQDDQTNGHDITEANKGTNETRQHTQVQFTLPSLHFHHSASSFLPLLSKFHPMISMKHFSRLFRFEEYFVQAFAVSVQTTGTFSAASLLLSLPTNVSASNSSNKENLVEHVTFQHFAWLLALCLHGTAQEQLLLFFLLFAIEETTVESAYLLPSSPTMTMQRKHSLWMGLRTGSVMGLDSTDHVNTSLSGAATVPTSDQEASMTGKQRLVLSYPQLQALYCFVNCLLHHEHSGLSPFHRAYLLTTSHEEQATTDYTAWLSATYPLEQKTGSGLGSGFVTIDQFMTLLFTPSATVTANENCSCYLAQCITSLAHLMTIQIPATTTLTPSTSTTSSTASYHPMHYAHPYKQRSLLQQCFLPWVYSSIEHPYQVLKGVLTNWHSEPDVLRYRRLITDYHKKQFGHSQAKLEAFLSLAPTTVMLFPVKWWQEWCQRMQLQCTYCTEPGYTSFLYQLGPIASFPNTFQVKNNANPGYEVTFPSLYDGFDLFAITDPLYNHDASGMIDGATTVESAKTSVKPEEEKELSVLDCHSLVYEIAPNVFAYYPMINTAPSNNSVAAEDTIRLLPYQSLQQQASFLPSRSANVREYVVLPYAIGRLLYTTYDLHQQEIDCAQYRRVLASQGYSLPISDEARLYHSFVSSMRQSPAQLILDLYPHQLTVYLTTTTDCCQTSLTPSSIGYDQIIPIPTYQPVLTLSWPQAGVTRKDHSLLSGLPYTMSMFLEAFIVFLHHRILPNSDDSIHCKPRSYRLWGLLPVQTSSGHHNYNKEGDGDQPSQHRKYEECLHTKDYKWRLLTEYEEDYSGITLAQVLDSNPTHGIQGFLLESTLLVEQNGEEDVVSIVSQSSLETLSTAGMSAIHATDCKPQLSNKHDKQWPMNKLLNHQLGDHLMTNLNTPLPSILSNQITTDSKSDQSIHSTASSRASKQKKKVAINVQAATTDINTNNREEEEEMRKQALESDDDEESSYGMGRIEEDEEEEDEDESEEEDGNDNDKEEETIVKNAVVPAEEALSEGVESAPRMSPTKQLSSTLINTNSTNDNKKDSIKSSGNSTGNVKNASITTSNTNNNNVKLVGTTKNNKISPSSIPSTPTPNTNSAKNNINPTSTKTNVTKPALLTSKSPSSSATILPINDSPVIIDPVATNMPSTSEASVQSIVSKGNSTTKSAKSKKSKQSSQTKVSKASKALDHAQSKAGNVLRIGLMVDILTDRHGWTVGEIVNINYLDELIARKGLNLERVLYVTVKCTLPNTPRSCLSSSKQATNTTGNLSTKQFNQLARHIHSIHYTTSSIVSTTTTLLTQPNPIPCPAGMKEEYYTLPLSSLRLLLHNTMTSKIITSSTSKTSQRVKTIMEDALEQGIGRLLGQHQQCQQQGNLSSGQSKMDITPKVEDVAEVQDTVPVFQQSSRLLGGNSATVHVESQQLAIQCEKAPQLTMPVAEKSVTMSKVHSTESISPVKTTTTDMLMSASMPSLLFRSLSAIVPLSPNTRSVKQNALEADSSATTTNLRLLETLPEEPNSCNNSMLKPMIPAEHVVEWTIDRVKQCSLAELQTKAMDIIGLKDMMHVYEWMRITQYLTWLSLLQPSNCEIVVAPQLPCFSSVHILTNPMLCHLPKLKECYMIVEPLLLSALYPPSPSPISVPPSLSPPKDEMNSITSSPTKSPNIRERSSRLLSSLNGLFGKSMINTIPEEKPNPSSEIAAVLPSAVIQATANGSVSLIVAQEPPISAATNTSTLVTMEREQPIGVVGLQNLGNTCFLNAAIQCLLRSPIFSSYLLVYIPSMLHTVNRDVKTKSAKGKMLGMFVDFMCMIYKLPRPQSEEATTTALTTITTTQQLIRPTFVGQQLLTGAPIISPQAFYNVFQSLKPQFQGNDQQDAQEFLAEFLDLLHEDMKALFGSNQIKNAVPSVPAANPLTNEDNGDNKDEDKEKSVNETVRKGITRKQLMNEGNKSWEEYLLGSNTKGFALFGGSNNKTNHSLITSLFQGQLCTVIECKTCGHTVNKYEPFSTLSLPLPMPNHAVRVNLQGNNTGPPEIPSYSVEMMTQYSALFGTCPIEMASSSTSTKLSKTQSVEPMVVVKVIIIRKAFRLSEYLLFRQRLIDYFTSFEVTKQIGYIKEKLHDSEYLAQYKVQVISKIDSWLRHTTMLQHAQQRRKQIRLVFTFSRFTSIRFVKEYILNYVNSLSNQPIQQQQEERRLSRSVPTSMEIGEEVHIVTSVEAEPEELATQSLSTNTQSMMIEERRDDDVHTLHVPSTVTDSWEQDSQSGASDYTPLQGITTGLLPLEAFHSTLLLLHPSEHYRMRKILDTNDTLHGVIEEESNLPGMILPGNNNNSSNSDTEPVWAPILDMILLENNKDIPYISTLTASKLSSNPKSISLLGVVVNDPTTPSNDPIIPSNPYSIEEYLALYTPNITHAMQSIITQGEFSESREYSFVPVLLSHPYHATVQYILCSASFPLPVPVLSTLLSNGWGCLEQTPVLFCDLQVTLPFYPSLNHTPSVPSRPVQSMSFHTLRLYDRVDALDHKNQWYAGSVVEILVIPSGTTGTLRPQQRMRSKTMPVLTMPRYIRVHFDGFASQWDEWYDESDYKKGYLLSVYTKTARKFKIYDLQIIQRQLTYRIPCKKPAPPPLQPPTSPNTEAMKRLKGSERFRLKHGLSTTSSSSSYTTQSMLDTTAEEKVTTNTMKTHGKEEGNDSVQEEIEGERVLEKVLLLEESVSVVQIESYRSVMHLIGHVLDQIAGHYLPINVLEGYLNHQYHQMNNTKQKKKTRPSFVIRLLHVNNLYALPHQPSSLSVDNNTEGKEYVVRDDEGNASMIISPALTPEQTKQRFALHKAWEGSVLYCPEANSAENISNELLEERMRRLPVSNIYHHKLVLAIDWEHHHQDANDAEEEVEESDTGSISLSHYHHQQSQEVEEEVDEEVMMLLPEVDYYEHVSYTAFQHHQHQQQQQQQQGHNENHNMSLESVDSNQYATNTTTANNAASVWYDHWQSHHHHQGITGNGNSNANTAAVRGALTLTQLFRQFTAIEEIHEYHCPFCTNKPIPTADANANANANASANANGLSRASVRVSLHHLPDILIIHLKRLVTSSVGSMKINTLVTFPTTQQQPLDLTAFTTDTMYATDIEDGDTVNPTPVSTYRLFGVVHHRGGVYGGHYTATTLTGNLTNSGSTTDNTHSTGNTISLDEVLTGMLGNNTGIDLQDYLDTGKQHGIDGNGDTGIWYQCDDEYVTSFTGATNGNRNGVDPRIVSESAYLLFYQKQHLSSLALLHYT